MNIIETRNAIIVGTMLGREDHGIFTSTIQLDYSGSGQGFGGYALDRYNKQIEKRVPHLALSVFIVRVLETLEVESWEKLKGTPCRVKADFAKVHAIGHLMKDQWFEPSIELEALSR